MGKITKALQKATEERLGRLDKISRIQENEHVIVRKMKDSKVDARLITYFLYHMKREFEVPYYHKKLKYCVTLEYWIRLMLVEFMGSVRAQKPYSSYFPSTRHESRCKKPPRKTEAAE